MSRKNIMINQNERNEKLINFCNPDISLIEAIQIATSLGLTTEGEKIQNTFVGSRLFKETMAWEIVETCLSFNNLDKITLELIEGKLGTKVALQVYRFYLERRRSNNLQEKDLIAQDKLLYKMQAVDCNKTFMDYLLKLT